MPDSFISAFLLILLVLDPLANALPFQQMTAHLSPERRRRVILRECLAGSGVLLAFALGGAFFLRYTGVQAGTLGITGGVLLFLIGLKMLFLGNTGLTDEASGAARHEPFLVPMAIPLFAGPASIAITVVNASPGTEHRWSWMAGMLAACATATAILVMSDRMLARLGGVAVAALGRLMGLALAAIAIQMVLDGFVRYWAALPKG